MAIRPTMMSSIASLQKDPGEPGARHLSRSADQRAVLTNLWLPALSRPAVAVLVDLRRRTGCARGVLEQPGRKAQSRGAVAGVEHDLAFSELPVRGHLRRVQHRGYGRSRGRQPLQGVVARQARTRLRNRGLAFLVTVDAFEMTKLAKLDREIAPVTHRLPKVIFRDDRQRDPAAVGAG